MTEVNLQQFAYEQGITKSIQAMTQQEKTLLRYKFVLQQTALAQGDFARTSDSWANQTRVLSERWKEFSTILGNVIIHVLTPAVKYLNAMLSNLITLAKTAVEAFGIETQIASTGAVIEDTTGAVTDLGNAAEEAGEKAKGALASFDELNVISMPDTSETSGDIGVGGGLDVPAVDIPETEENVTKAESIWSKWLDGIAEKTENLQAAWSRFWDMLKDSCEEIFNIFKDFYNYYWKPILTFAITKSLPQLLDIFTKLGKAVNWDAIRTGLKNFWQALEPFMESLTTGFLNALETIVDIFLAPAISFTSTLLGKGLEGLAYIIKKIPPEVVEAFGGALAGVMTALLMIKTATTLAGIITSVKTALSGLLAVLTAHPIAAIAVALGAIVGALLSFYTNSESYKHNKEFDKDVENAERMAESYRELMESTQQSGEEREATIKYYQSLWKELQNIVDQNGNVKKGYEERAQFITTALSEAMDIEIQLIDNTITGYQNLQKEMDNLLAKQRADVWLEESRKRFDESVKLLAEAEGQQVEAYARLREEQQKYNELLEERQKWQEKIELGTGGNVAPHMIEHYDSLISAAEANIKKAQESFEDSETAIRGYYENIAQYEQDYANAIEGNYQAIINAHANIGKSYEELAQKSTQSKDEQMQALKDQKEAAENDVKELETQLELMQQRMADGVKGITQTMLDETKEMIRQAKEQISKTAEEWIRIFGNVNQEAINLRDKLMQNMPWLPSISISKNGQTGPFKPSYIPKLATGTVVPPNREFLSILGDNKREPEVVSPLSTIRRAVAEALAANASGETVIDLTINLEGDAIYRDVIRRQTAKNKAFGY